VTLDYKQHTVLFVDDEEANRVVFRATFSEDFKLVVASSASEALDVLRRMPVAVLITDQRMPDTSGVELVEIVRREYPDVVRIIITAYTDLRTAIDAINRGQVSRFISKPWNSDEVRIYLRQAIERFHLARRIQELQSQVLQAERMVTLGLAAGSIAHDITSPLASLLNNLDGLEADLEQLTGELPEASRAELPLGEMQDQLSDCKLAANDISRILQAVRRSIQDQNLLEPVHLADVVQTAMQLIHSTVHNKARVQVSCDRKVWVQGDAPALVQLLVNLLVNAAKAIEGGPASGNKIELDVYASDAWAVMRIRDTGCGMDPGLKARIFEPLFTTRTDSGGTGLGLSIVKRAVERHNGEILVESQTGRGTDFTVKIPRLDNTPHE
jgi:signal transduction histidine kinase